MPQKPSRPCATPGCRNLQPCPSHRRGYDDRRGSSAERGYNAEWRKYRLWFLQQVVCSVCGRNHVLCEECQRVEDQDVTWKWSTVVDHIQPHRGDLELFFNHANHQGLCTPHHNAKSNRERLFPNG